MTNETTARGREGLWRKILSLDFKKQVEIPKTSSGLCQLMKSFQMVLESLKKKKKDIYQENLKSSKNSRVHWAQPQAIPSLSYSWVIPAGHIFHFSCKLKKKKKSQN